MDTERTSVYLDARSLRALAHPLRVRMLGLLRSEGPATATGLAARIGESSGTTSYHLRQLAGADLVVEDEERGNGRERWWRAAQTSTRLEGVDLLNDPELRPALDVYLRAVADACHTRVVDYLASQYDWPKRWQTASDLSDYRLSLSAAELRRLNEEVEQLVESYRRPARRGDEQVVVQYQALPQRPGPSA